MTRRVGIDVPGGRLRVCMDEGRRWFEFVHVEVISRERAIELAAEAVRQEFPGARMAVSGQTLEEFIATLRWDEP